MFQIIRRSISTTASLAGKRNFRKFLLYNKRGTRVFKQQRAANPDLYPDMPIDKRGVRDTGVTVDGKFVEIPERIPELIVPNLEGCKLKPYVSYKAPDVVQSEFTSQDLFNAVYSQKIIDDWKSGKLNEDGSPAEPSTEEALTKEEAWIKARKTGSDMF
ncbi:39S ribosomal protein L41, mitochondrial [Anopheles darlingi]|uniref:39S ribosomal protein L41, mitochondrial n=1 Tax=Anopheles darlingi TaxID=43151 RepID=W5JA93_ANODA|nr:39S ribosomal protein L41, mitochondrial [Anopheles darlingi]ETN59694.1 39S ribosomal protein L41, mitochondrial [Anopheles darlingi]